MMIRGCQYESDVIRKTAISTGAIPMARKKKRRGRRRGRPSALARLTVADLMREVERRRGMMSDLASQRDRLQSELDAINAEIADLESIGASAPMAPRRGPG